MLKSARMACQAVIPKLINSVFADRSVTLGHFFLYLIKYFGRNNGRMAFFHTATWSFLFSLGIVFCLVTAPLK